MEEMVVTEMTTKDKAYKVGSFLLGGFLIYSFATDMNWGKLVMAIIFILVSGYSKEIVAKSDGVDYTYNYFITKRYNKIVFEELDEVVAIRDGRNHLIYFVKGNHGEKLSMHPEKMDELLAFIRRNSEVEIREEHLL